MRPKDRGEGMTLQRADAVLEFPAWTSENVEKMLKILEKEGE